MISGAATSLGSENLTLFPAKREIWKSVGVEEDHILPGNSADNFWGKKNMAHSLHTGMKLISDFLPQKWVLSDPVALVARFTLTE